MTAYDEKLAAAIAAKGIPLTADLVDTGLSREARAARLADLRAREAARKVVLRGKALLDHPLMDRIAFAIFDPGAIVPRGDNYQEPLHRWQARAITFVLAEGAAS